MIAHLEHTISSGYKEGYGALLTIVFHSLQVPLDHYDGLFMRRELYIQESTLLNLGLRVKDSLTKWHRDVLKENVARKKEEKEKKKEKEKKEKGNQKKEKRKGSSRRYSWN